MSQRIFASSIEAEAAFYEAIERADLTAMMAVWADDEEIACIHPGGPRLTGIEAVRESWSHIFKGSPGLSFQLTHQQYRTGKQFALHSVHENIRVVGDPGAHVVVATNIYSLKDGSWRMVMHHASPIIAGGAEQETPEPALLH